MATGEFTAFLNDAASRRAASEADSAAVVRRGNVRTAVRSCRESGSPDILLVDLDGEQNAIAFVAELLEVCRPDTVILAIGSENNVTLANELYRGGIFLYLTKPLDAESLRSAIREVADVTVADPEDRPRIQTSRVMLIHGKGMGVNTVTVLLARLAAEMGRYVNCVDLDPNFGSLSLAFNVRPERGLAQVLQDWNDADDLIVDRIHTHVTNRIGLVAYPLDQPAQTSFDDENLGSLINALNSRAHLILVCGASMTDILAIQHLVTNHAVVFEPTPAGVSVAARWLRQLLGSNSSLIMNRARPLPNLLSTDHLRNALGGRLPDAEIPYVRGMAEAMAMGEPERALTRRQSESLNGLLQALMGAGTIDVAEQ